MIGLLIRVWSGLRFVPTGINRKENWKKRHFFRNLFSQMNPNFHTLLRVLSTKMGIKPILTNFNNCWSIGTYFERQWLCSKSWHLWKKYWSHMFEFNYVDDIRWLGGSGSWSTTGLYLNWLCSRHEITS
jgi:hypothetical protein